jgi:hypothetical protein
VPANKTIAEKIDLMMRWFGDQSQEIGQLIPYNRMKDYPTAWCRSPDEWHQLLAHLADDLKYLKLWADPSQPTASVTIKGLQWLGDKPRVASNKGFIAMWFDRSLDPLKLAIEKGISSAGYSPLRIDEDHYTGGVMDRIIANIKESRFVVADFKGNRGGVYYEAGFAAGLGIPVFSLCEEGQTSSGPERIHFDIAHLRLISWTMSALPQLTDKLMNGLLAVVGRGPVSP